MAILLTLNPGSNSLKADVVEVRSDQRFGCESAIRTSAMVEDIGKDKPASFSRMQGRETAESHDVEAKSFTDATGVLLDWLRDHAGEHGAGYEDVALAAVRVVHGGESFDKPVIVDASVEREIEVLQRFAPLHNARSLEVIRALRKHAPEMKIAAGFDTSFYRRMPEVAWRYPLPPELADKHGIRRYGFHGFSHRSLLERYALETKRPLEEIRLVSLHLESGCSATARTIGTRSRRKVANSERIAVAVMPSSASSINGSATWSVGAKKPAYSRLSASVVSRYGIIAAKSLAGRARIQAS